MTQSWKRWARRATLLSMSLTGKEVGRKPIISERIVGEVMCSWRKTLLFCLEWNMNIWKWGSECGHFCSYYNLPMTQCGSAKYYREGKLGGEPDMTRDLGFRILTGKMGKKKMRLVSVETWGRMGYWGIEECISERASTLSLSRWEI